MSTPGFIELQLDPLISYGTSGGPSFNTLVVSNNSRNEQRFQQQSRGYWKLTLSFTDKSKAQLTAIQNHFAIVMGKTYGWRFRNWRDYQATNEPIAALSTPTTLQLTKTTTVAGVSTITLIRKPDMTLPITLTRNGSAFPSSGNWTLDTTTGIVTFTASQTGNTFTWTGQYDMAARFDVDDMGGSWDDFNVFSWPSINIMEIQV